MFTDVIRDRMHVIRRFAVKGDVLDVGCVDARSNRHSSAARVERHPDHLFQTLVRLNPRTLGIDIDRDGVEALRTRGLRALCANAETMNLKRQFDVVVAGEIIEHLENPGLFLRNLRRHLRPRGVLILSTPNPFYWRQVWKIWRYGVPQVHEEHVNWQDPITLRELLSRTGFDLVEGYWVETKGRFQGWRTWFRKYFCHSFLIVARPKADCCQQAA